jgi:hypothetical protein
MGRPYSLLFLGHQTFKGTLSLEDSTDCWQQVTISLHGCLRNIPHVNYSFRDNHPDNLGSYNQLPKVDAVLFWGIPQTWMSYDHARLKRATGCRAIITVGERAVTQSSDWRFALRGEGVRTTRMSAPVRKSVYRYSRKQPRSVLIDHWDQDTPSDRTDQIEGWLLDAMHDLHVVRYVQSDREHGVARDKPNLKEFRRAPFLEWLAATDQVETFVVTHRESYGHAILDMFARGTRVACPSDFLPRHFGERFHFDTFDTKHELIEILQTRPDPSKLMKNREALTDWCEAVESINRRFEVLLRIDGCKALTRLQNAMRRR